ncbi:MAG: hypothetical protein LIO92_09935 [Clostridiales bacterium]|nr:hypothetical protein [Clostridiales bacterium]
MAQIKYFDKRVGITYVYESESYYDQEKHQSRSKRKLIGKIDPETGEMIPTGKKGRPSKNAGISAGNDPDYKKLYEKALTEVSRKDEKITALEQELQETQKSVRNLSDIIQKISSLCAQAGK